MKKVEPQVNFPALEKEILEYWKENTIFEKSVGPKDSRPEFVFYDGPPFATGLPHYGHLVPGLLKDIFPRYKTMQGFRVERQWGWDCHGLPIENIIEKELGFKTKKEIEEFGIEKFNERCRTKVLSYTQDWKKIMERFGRFADLDHAYKTMDVEYMDSIWWVFKTLWDKGLVYESYRIMHICPRCETTLSQAEVSDGYKDIKDLAVTAKFELVDEPGTYLLAWTTTPWTLPGNVALAVGKDIRYVKVKSGESFYIVAKELVEKVFEGKEYQGVEEFSSTDLVGKSYLPLFTDYFDQADLENKGAGWKVYAADFVDTISGTGIVHIAPAFGEDDMLLGKAENLPWVQHVNMDGTMKTEVKEFAGSNVKPIENPAAFDVEIIKSLAQKELLFAKQKYEHSYPHCWRCDTPLLNYATSSWFIAVEKIKSAALENAKSIHWSPEHIKEGRFGKWLEGARDWSISRQRFWASCIPLWVCSCGENTVIGSRQELCEKSGVMVEDLHKHTVDAVTLPCEACGESMKRVPDVLDTWFDSGSMPYASQKHMGEGELERFPANFIAEGIDQTRSWFYYLHILGSAITGKNAFENCVVNGIVLAEDGKKMSKKLNNYPDPLAVIEKYGADALRMYIATSPVVSAENLYFSEKDLASITKNTFRMLWNSYSFFTTYAVIDNWSPAPKASEDQGLSQKESGNILDKWILAELQVLIEAMTMELENYQPSAAARLIMPFVDNLSNWYIRRSRKRFWKNENDTDKNEAYQTLYTVLVELSKLMAPFTPFIAEEIYRNLTGEESVHLAKWPKVNTELANRKLIIEMENIRNIINVGLEIRSSEKIKVRQPLAALQINYPEAELFKEIIAEELNVKQVVVVNKVERGVFVVRPVNIYSEPTELTAKINIATELGIDVRLTPELRLESEAREIIRAIQEGRKKAGFNVEDRVMLGYEGKENVFAVHQDEITKEVLAEGGVQRGAINEAEYTETADLDSDPFTFWLKKN